jgi:hypothetical protein
VTILININKVKLNDIPTSKFFCKVMHVALHASVLRPFLVGYLTTLFLSGLYSVYERMFNECGAVGGIKIDRRSGST